MAEFDLYKKEGKGVLPKFKHVKKLDDPALYVPSPELVDAVNVALALGQPLLVTGEPGTGKTQLAYHLANFFNLGKPLVFAAKTTSTAKDLFYRYDALGHFQYNQNQQNTPLPPEELEAKFIYYAALGEAIKRNERLVVLIDEIDKAPRDLPNDLLLAIEQLSFSVPELPMNEKKELVTYETSQENRPVIILTSNSEKNLPDAFLRRMSFFHIKFPEPSQLEEILKKRTGITHKKVTAHFLNIRKLPRLKKVPATAEFLAWALLLQNQGFPFDKLDGTLNDKERRILNYSYTILAKNEDDLDALKKL